VLCALSVIFCWFLDAVTTSASARTSRIAITLLIAVMQKHLGGSKHKTAERAFVSTHPGEPVPGTTVRQPLPPAEAAAAAASRAMRPHLLPPQPAPPSAPATSAGATAGCAGPGANRMLPAPPPPPPQRLPRAGFASGPVRSGSAVSSGPTPSPLPRRSSMSLPNAAPGMRLGHRPSLMVPRQVALGQQLQPAPSGAAQATAGARRNEGFSASGRRAVTTPSEQQRAAAATAEAGGTPQHSSPPATPARGGAHRAECKVCRWTGSTAELAQHFQARSIISSIEGGTMLTNNR